MELQQVLLDDTLPIVVQHCISYTVQDSYYKTLTSFTKIFSNGRLKGIPLQQ